VTTQTRRRILLCAVVLALAVPAELVLVKALTTDAQSASSAWADSLSSEELDRAAARIQDYSPQHRKDIMSRLAPERRAQVWVDHIARYRDARPELSTEQVDALNAAIDAATVTLALSGSPERARPRASTQVVAERVKELFGAEVADYLLHRLGNRTTRVLANAAPWHLTLSDYVRERFVLQAETAECNCNLDFGCDALSMTRCTDERACVLDETWPACGWFWNEVCDGLCKIGMIGSQD
jgi:hypothetical protein